MPRPQDPSPTAGALALAVQAHDGGQVLRREEWVAEEVPVALVVNGQRRVQRLATPLDLEDLAIGQLRAEGLIDRPQQVLHLAVAAHPDARWPVPGLAVHVTLAADAAGAPAPLAMPAVDAATLMQALQAFAGMQGLRAATGATHAAAWFDLDGRLRWLREDVGRHNALDKLIGCLLRAGFDPAGGFVGVTSRASHEMVHKALQAGIGVLVAVSAPTVLAVRTAEAAGMVLAGYTRGARTTVYSHAARLAVR